MKSSNSLYFRNSRVLVHLIKVTVVGRLYFTFDILDSLVVISVVLI